MSLVFSPHPFRLWFFLVVLLASYKSQGQPIETEGNTLMVFHDEELPAETVDYMTFESEEDLLFRIYVIDHKEPHDSRFGYKIFVQCEEGEDFVKLGRVQVEGDELNYCALEEPEIDDEHLILYGHPADDHGNCLLDKTGREAYPLKEIKEACDLSP